jgi:hypothetical protein
VPTYLRRTGRNRQHNCSPSALVLTVPRVRTSWRQGNCSPSALVLTVPRVRTSWRQGNCSPSALVLTVPRVRTSWRQGKSRSRSPRARSRSPRSRSPRSRDRRERDRDSSRECPHPLHHDHASPPALYGSLMRPVPDASRCVVHKPDASMRRTQALTDGDGPVRSSTLLRKRRETPLACRTLTPRATVPNPATHPGRNALAWPPPPPPRAAPGRTAHAPLLMLCSRTAADALLTHRC